MSFREEKQNGRRGEAIREAKGKGERKKKRRRKRKTREMDNGQRKSKK
jgi:hypothetical protein